MQVRSSTHKKPMIVAIGDAARAALLEWYPVAAGTAAHNPTRTIAIEKEQAELWDLTTVKRQKTLTISVIANTSIVICAESLAEKDQELLKQFEKSYVLYLTDNAKQDKNDLYDLIWLCGRGVDHHLLSTCNKQEIDNLKCLHKWLDESGFDCRSIAKVTKSDLFEAIKKIHSIENRTYLLLQCLNEETLLGKRFWTKDWDEFRELSLDRGLLKDICDELIRINPVYKGIIEAKAYLRSAKDWCDEADKVIKNGDLNGGMTDYCDAILVDPVHAAIYRRKFAENLKEILENKNNDDSYNDLLKRITIIDLNNLIIYTSVIDEQSRVSLLLLFFDSNTAIYKVLSAGESPDITKGIYKVIYDYLIEINPHYALTINQCLENNSNEIHYYKDQAKKHEDAGEIDKAIEIYRIILEKDKDNFDAYRRLGSLYKEQKKYNRSISYYTKALKHPSFQSLSLKDQDSLYCKRGDSYLYIGKNQEAIADFQKALNINSESFVACYGLALNYSRLDKTELALKYINKAIKLLKDENGIVKDPKYRVNIASYYCTRGYILHVLGNLEKAEKDSRKANLLDPDNVFVYSNHGNILHEKGNLTEALKFFDKFLSLSKDSRIYNARALAHEALKNYELAINDYRCAISKKHNGAKNKLRLLLQSDVLTPDVNADVILSAIELFDHQEQLALMIACFSPASLYMRKGEKLDLESKLGNKLSTVIESICNKTDANYNDAMSQLLGEDYQPVKARIEEKNKNKENDADQYMQFFNQVVCKETLIFWENKESDKDAPIYQMYHIAQDSSKSTMLRQQEIMALANEENEKGFVFNRDGHVIELYRQFKENDISNLKESMKYFARIFYQYYSEMICQHYGHSKLADKWLALLNAIIQLRPHKTYYEARANFLCQRSESYHDYVSYEKNTNQKSDAEVMTFAVVEDLMVKDLKRIKSYEVLAKFYEKSDPKKALEYYLMMKNPPILPVATLYMQLDMHRDALYKYHHLYVVLGIKMNDGDLIFSFIKNLIAKNGFVENKSDNTQLLYQLLDARMIKQLLDVCPPLKRGSVMVYIQEHSSLLYKRLEEFEYVAKYQDKSEEKKESAFVQWSIFPAKDKNGNKNKSKSADDNRPESSSSSSDYNL